MSTSAVPARKRALITGAKGFTGRYLADELSAHGWAVWGLGAHPDAVDPHYRCVDLDDAKTLNDVLAEVQPDAVLHLAAVAFVGHGDADDFYRVNLLGTRRLLAGLAALKDKSPSSVLLASSANVYGNAQGGVLTEATPPAPANDYAVSKLAMEHMARLFMDRLPITLVRPFNYTGVGQSTNFLLPKIVQHFRDGAKRIELGNLDVWRDFSDVRAVVQAYRRLLDAQAAGAVFNVCSGATHSLREVLAMAVDLSGRQIEIVVNPAFVRANEVRSLSGSPDRLVECIGPWSSPPLRETLAWMLNAPGDEAARLGDRAGQRETLAWMLNAPGDGRR